MDKIVVWDPSGVYWQGGIVSGEVAAALEARGVVLLPVDRAILNAGAISGFFFRSWGAGWPIVGAIPKLCCPMQLRATPFDSRKPNAPKKIHWVARLVPHVDNPPDWKPLGTIRLASDSGQLGAFGVGLTPTDLSVVELANLEKIDERGGWTIGGEAFFGVQTDTTVGLGLYCSGPGLRVAWAAVSQAP